MPFTLDLVADTHPDSDPALCLMRKNGELPTEVPLRSREWARKMVKILQLAVEEDREANKVMVRSGKALGHSAKGLLTLIVRELLLARPGDPEQFIKRANAASIAEAMFNAAGASFKKEDFNFNGVATMVNEFFPGANCTNKAVEDVVELLNQLGDGYDPDKPGNGSKGRGRNSKADRANESGSLPEGESNLELGAEDVWQRLEVALAVLHSEVYPESEHVDLMEVSALVRGPANRLARVQELVDRDVMLAQFPNDLHRSVAACRLVAASEASPRDAMAIAPVSRSKSVRHTRVRRCAELLWSVASPRGFARAAIVLLVVGILLWQLLPQGRSKASDQAFLQLVVNPTGSRVTENFSLAEWSARETITIGGEQRVQSKPVTVRVAVLGVPEELLSGVVLQLKVDKISGVDSEPSPSIRNGEVVEVAQAMEAGARLYFVSRSSALEEAIRKGFHPTIRIERVEK